jgi:threonine/homoserine/homoserine lactone efflux protein
MPADAVPAPGSLSVPPLDGWQGIVVALVVVVVVAVVFLVLLAVGAMRAGRTGSPEWQAWLDARSRSRDDGPGPPLGRAD